MFFYCASPMVPTGGAKDAEPPKILLQMPESGSSAYQGDRIEWLFDEYIVFQGGEDKVIITPPMQEKPKFIVKGKSLIMQLPEALDTSVTYSVSFVGAIKDFTEGNVLNAHKYVFSTGANIDSASLSGKLINAFDNQAIENVMVGLYEANDTGILSYSKPKYLALTNKNGEFTIDYVQNANYVLAALQDKNFNLIYDQEAEAFSLPSEAIFVGNNTVLEEKVRVFVNESKTLIDGYKQLTNNKLYFYFNKSVQDIQIELNTYNPKDLAYFTSNNDTLYYHWFDSSVQQLEFVIGLDGQKSDSIHIPLKKLPLVEILALQNQTIPQNQAISILAPKTIQSFDPSKIIVKDSLQQNQGFKCVIDYDKLLISLNNALLGSYFIQVDTLAIQYLDESYNNKALAKVVNITETQTKSKIILSIFNNNLDNTIIELYDSNKKRLYEENITMLSSYTFEDIGPGTYFLRVYVDQNENGKWDTGNFENKVPAESTLFYSKPIEIKANWDKELNINF